MDSTRCRTVGTLKHLTIGDGCGGGDQPRKGECFPTPSSPDEGDHVGVADSDAARMAD